MNSVSPLIIDTIEKSINLDLLKELTRQSEEKLKQKAAELVQEKKTLDKLHNQLWTMNDAFCDSVWKFSAENNFPGFINQYLEAPIAFPRQSKPNDPEMIRILEKEVQTLTLEIKQLQNDLDNMSLKNNATKEKSKIKQIAHSSNFVLKTPRKVPIKTEIKSSKFSVKTKSRICKKFEQT